MGRQGTHVHCREDSWESLAKKHGPTKKPACRYVDAKTSQESELSQGSEKSVRNLESIESDSDASLLAAAQLGDQGAHAGIYAKYAGLVETAILSFKGRIPPHIDECVLRSDGSDALLNAISTCPRGKFTNFGGYAFKAIKNAFNSTVRGDHGGRAGTRDQWERANEFAQVQISLANEFGQKPTDEEVYERLGWSNAVRCHHATNPTGRPTQIAVETSAESENVEIQSPTQGRVETTETTEFMQIRELLRAAIEQLREDERYVIQRRYLLDVPITRRECAEEMGISVGRVDRTAKIALKKLKNAITE